MKSCVVDGARLAYTVDGPPDALVLVLSNSLGTDYRMWDAQVDGFGERLRVVRYDSRGHGQSNAPSDEYAIDQLGRDLLAVLDALGVERAAVCGLSLGGVVAQWVAIHHPERVERAVFANTAARIGTPELWQARIEAVRAGGMVAIRDAVVARFLSEGFRQRNPDVAQSVGQMLEHSDPRGYMASCAALRDADLRDLVECIRIPCLVVAGELDEATPPAQASDLHAAIPDSQLVVLAGAGHLSNIEQPDEFTRRVLAFVTS